MTTDQPSDNTENQPHRRRVRYGGTHPKTFDEKYKEHAIEAHPDLRRHLRDKGKTPAGSHIPIMVAEILQYLAPRPGDIVADCTLGYGGHAAALAPCIGPSGRLIGLDVDGVQLERTQKRLAEQCPDVPMQFFRSNFAGLAKVMAQTAPEGFDVVFADLGLSSMQIDDPTRGMSYRHDGPLDMRMDQRRPHTAADLLNTLPEETLSDALRDLSDEPDHRLLARRIVDQRQREPFGRIGPLVELILDVKGMTLAEYKRRQRQTPHRLHPAARTFQTLRMLVNDEQAALKELLRVVPWCLRSGGRIGIISFHSGEDRLVKQAFANGQRDGIYQEFSKNPITPTREETAANTRSTPAKFRWARRAT
jgi:16S rRNA (cytosine1402-N4)-methyltransferase